MRSFRSIVLKGEVCHYPLILIVVKIYRMYIIFSLHFVGISSCIVSNQAKIVKLCMTIYASYVEVSGFDVSLGFFAGET